MIIIIEVQTDEVSSSARVAANVHVLPEAGYFIMSSPELKITRITNAEKPFIDAAKQVKSEPIQEIRNKVVKIAKITFNI